MHHIVLLIDTSQSSARRRLVESAKDILKDVLPKKTFEVGIVTFDNIPKVEIGKEKYSPKMLDNISNGYGLSNLCLALSKCYKFVSENKKATTILYVGDGMATDDYNTIAPQSPSNIHNHIALLLTRGTIISPVLQCFERYTFDEEDLKKLQKRLNQIIEK